MRKKIVQGRGTVRAVRNRTTGEVAGYRALLPRELSRAPKGIKHPEKYQQPLGELYATAQEARELLDAAIAELRKSGRPIEALGIDHFVGSEIRARYQDARRKYKHEARANRAVSTWRSIERTWLPKAAWWTWDPQHIQPIDLQRFVDWLKDEGQNPNGEPLSGSFIRNVVMLLRASFERAHVTPNPASDLRVPEKTAPKVPYLTLQEQRAVFGCREIPLSDRIMIGCGMGAGLRVNELLALRWEDVRLTDDDPHIRIRFGGQHSAPTKGDRERRVELYEPGLGFFRLLAEQKADSGPVFVGERGGYLKHWPNQFADWSEDAGVARMTSHIMRHTFAVSMLSGTWGYEPRSLEFVGEQLGHAEIQTTERFYGAFASETWQREVRRMTGRADRPTKRDVVTAASLLGLSDAPGDASAVGSEPKTATTTALGAVPRHSPQSSEKREKGHENQDSDALAHQGFLEDLAERFLQLAGAGDGRAFELLRELPMAVLAQAEYQLAHQVLAGGPHSFTRGIELAELILSAARADLRKAVRS